ncbi:MAG TPA: hypothetical protein DHV28_09030 [Ignavibacteriales bacterium]|nr:hypothetical protein [Ignavibacteriales bacterium]
MKNYAYLFVLLLIVAFSIFVYAFQSGITGRTKKTDTTGCYCHGETPSTSVVVSINGPDTLTINETATYTVTISGGPLVRGGTDIAVSSGILFPGDGLKNVGGELTHTEPKAPINSIVTFEFTYTAPDTTGDQTIYANGNSVNYNQQPSGDQWNFADNKIIHVQSPTFVSNEILPNLFSLSQNYPNPFNPSTKIRYAISQTAFTSLKVYSILGEEVATLINEEKTSGIYEINFDATNLTSGTYIYRLQAGDYVETRKMILLK